MIPQKQQCIIIMISLGVDQLGVMILLTKHLNKLNLFDVVAWSFMLV